MLSLVIHVYEVISLVHNFNLDDILLVLMKIHKEFKLLYVCNKCIKL